MTDTTMPSIYAVTFNENNRDWISDPTVNNLFIRSVLAYCNNRLKSQGHLFLNEVYDALSFPRIQSGQLIGWLAENTEMIEFDLITNDDGSIIIDVTKTAPMPIVTLI